MLSSCLCQLRHINHASINIATSMLGGRRWHGIWRLRWSRTRYWRSLQIWRCVMWKYGWMLTNRRQLMWINHLISQYMRHKYHWWWQIISLLVTVLAIKWLVITTSFLRKARWLLTNWGQLRWIDEWIIQWRRHRYHQWWQLVALWVTDIAIKVPVIKRSHSLPTLSIPCSTFAVTINTLWTYHDKCNMSLWWCYVLVIFFVYGQQKVRANFLAQQLQSCLGFSTRNKIDYEIFVSL